MLTKYMLKLIVTLFVIFTPLAVNANNSGEPYDRHEALSKDPANIFDNSSVAELVVAAIKGDTKKIDKLIDVGTDINYQGKYGWTPLHFVFNYKKLWFSNKVGFLHLLKRGANPNILAKNGRAVIHYAVDSHSDIWYLNMVLLYGGNPSLPTGMSNYNFSKGGIPLMTDFESPLHRAVSINPQKKSVEKIKLLASAGADTSLRTAAGNNPLDMAIMLKLYEQAFYLLTYDSDCYNKTNGPYNVTISDKINRGNQILLEPMVSTKNAAYWYSALMIKLKEKCPSEWINVTEK